MVREITTSPIINSEAAMVKESVFLAPALAMSALLSAFLYVHSKVVLEVI